LGGQKARQRHSSGHPGANKAWLHCDHANLGFSEKAAQSREEGCQTGLACTVNVICCASTFTRDGTDTDNRTRAALSETFGKYAEKQSRPFEIGADDLTCVDKVRFSL